MKKILIFVMILNTLAFAAGDAESKRKDRADKQLEKEMENEKKYAREQTFYNEDNYDFKGAEVNKESIDGVPDLEPQYDFDMNSVYD